MATLFELVRSTLVTRFEAPAEELRPETFLGDVLLDSLDFVEFATLVGDQLRIRISDDEIENAETLSDVVFLLENKGAVAR